MIFKIADGREYFYQWDIDRQIIVSDPTIKEVHFCNRTDDCSLVVEVVDGAANVPNIILQKSFDVRVFGYDGKATLHEATFKVKARTQPADYVYTETVVKSIEEILEAAETVTTTANEFYEFVEDHTLGFTDDGEGNVELVAVDAEGGNVDLTDYYTKTEVDELIENIDTSEIDLTGYATEEYVDNAINSITFPEDDCHVYVDESNSFEDITAAIEADKLPVYRHIYSGGAIQYLPLAYKQVNSDALTTYYFSAKIALPLQNYDAEISCTLADGATVWSELTTTAMQSKISVNTEPDPSQRVVPDLKYLKVDGRSYKIPEGGETDLSNYYTKDETTQAIQDALNAIGVAEGGAY